MTTQDPDDQIQQMLLEASVHPSLSRIDPSLLARAQQLLAPRKMGFDPGIEPEHRQRLINHLRQEAFDLLDGFPSLDEEGLEDREIRVDAHAVAEELAARTEGLCVDSIGLGAGAADIDFDGIALHVDAPGDEDGTTLCVRLVDAEDFTLAPDAPAGPASALAVACALVQRADALLARARALVLAPRAGTAPATGMLVESQGWDNAEVRMMAMDFIVERGLQRRWAEYAERVAEEKNTEARMARMEAED